VIEPSTEAVPRAAAARPIPPVSVAFASLRDATRPWRWTILVYLASRILLLAVALVAAKVNHISLASEIGRWDGTWYAKVASNGYPRQVAHAQTTLGFFPLYPLVIWVAVHAPGPPNSVILAGAVVSCIGGLVATILVQQLATDWWGKATGRRAALLFCFFPGSIVFSMAYAEGLLIPLAAGCILALQRRRWILAGILAGFATAVQPDALALVVVCVVCAGVELHRRGWRDRDARRSLFAPLLSVAGIGSFAVFLWAWTGTPFATLQTQHYGWGEKVDPLALAHQGRFLAHELRHAQLAHLHVYWGPVAGLLGAVVLLAGLAMLLRKPQLVSLEAMTLTLVIGFLAVVSENVPPNPRILITAFPAVLVFAHRFRHRGYVWLFGSTAALLILTSALTYGGRTLTP
jgi:Mannosyltransferase (PIG-V)